MPFRVLSYSVEGGSLFIMTLHLYHLVTYGVVDLYKALADHDPERLGTYFLRDLTTSGTLLVYHVIVCKSALFYDYSIFQDQVSLVQTHLLFSSSPELFCHQSSARPSQNRRSGGRNQSPALP